jgi:phage recombination protein Bet
MGMLPATQHANPSLVTRMANRFGVDPDKMMQTLKQTAFRTEEPVSNEQMMALLVVAEQYGLNPWTREIYAFPDKHRGIVPVVGVDGWARIINSGDQFDGVDFIDGPPATDKKYKDAPEWIEAVIYRKDRAHPVRVRERMSECFRAAVGPWQSHPSRMLRHKALIQCARLAFGFVGIFDEDEAARIIDVGGERVVDDSAAVATINAEIAGNGSVTEASGEVDPQATAKQADAERGSVKDPNAPQTTFGKLCAKIQESKDVDVLDAHADMIQYLPTDAERSDATTLYKQQRSKLVAAS